MISFFSTIPAMADTNNRDRSESEALVPGVAGRGSRPDTPRPVGFPGTASLSPATPGDSADLCCVATSPPRSCERVSGPRYATLANRVCQRRRRRGFCFSPFQGCFCLMNDLTAASPAEAVNPHEPHDSHAAAPIRLPHGHRSNDSRQAHSLPRAGEQTRYSQAV